MKIIRDQGVTFFPRVIALGTFDGVHRGHQKLIEAGRELSGLLGAALRVVTFDRHPLEVLRPEKAPPLIMTTLQKARRLALLGVDEMQMIPFSRERADQEPEAFLEELRSDVNLRGIVAGWNYTFGKDGRGTAETLIRDGKAHGYEVRIIPPVTTQEGKIMSSSAIRKALLSGYVQEATLLLGGFPEYVGTALTDSELGQEVFRLESRLLPPDGVYFAGLSDRAENRFSPRKVRLVRGFLIPEKAACPLPPAGKRIRIRLMAGENHPAKHKK